MLDWLTGIGHDGAQDDPETPAHLFAARAFRTAFFGTPAPPRETGKEDEDYVLKLARGTSNASPVKGILLTPGTVGAKRKTVSFTAAKQLEVVKEDEVRPDARREEEENEIAVQPTEKAVSSATRPLRRALFDKPKPVQAKTQVRVQTQDPRADSDTQTSAPCQISASEGTPFASTVEVLAGSQNKTSADVTVDLGQPRSVSGRHWMKEYQRDHAVSKAEMKRLIRYSQTAKNQAAKRDKEASHLREKLEKSELQVQELEREVARLKQNNLDRTDTKARPIQPEPHVTSSVSTISSDSELDKLRKAADGATRRAAKLEKENEAFKNTILKVKEEMAKYESRHKESVERRRRKDEKNAAQRKALREKVVNYRTQLQQEFDAFQAKAEKDKAELLREIDFLRGELSSASPEKSDLISSGDPLRQLLARIHEQPTDKAKGGTKEDQPEMSGRQPTRKSKRVASGSRPAKTPLARIKDDWQDINEDSSPTILEGHLRRASKKSNEDSPATSRIDLTKEVDERVPLSPRPTLIMNSPAKRDTKGGAASVLTTKRQADVATTANTKVGRNIHIRPRAGLTAKTTTTTTTTSATRSGLTPEREAAARLRIAQRSAEKQRSTKFIFEDDWLKENRDVLQERPINGV